MGRVNIMILGLCERGKEAGKTFLEKNNEEIISL
jgi:hypothetical protein